jgi:glycine cleavage system transcriptional repressor
VTSIFGHKASRFLKVSGLGPDRLGIVHAVSRVIANHHGNIIIQRSTQLAGDFSLIMVSAFESENAHGLSLAIHELEQLSFGDGFRLGAVEITLSSFAQRPDDSEEHTFLVNGPDQQGIIESMTLHLLKNNVNLDAMDSEVTYDSETGSPRFWSRFQVALTPHVTIDAFVGELRQIAKNLDLDVEIES